jgi:hypothetical protein
MYRDLLTRALGSGEEGRRPNDLLLADLVRSRARLCAVEGTSTTPAADALARELSYDTSLIRLCESLEVRAGASGYANPFRERARLEHELSARGVTLGAARA